MEGDLCDGRENEVCGAAARGREDEPPVRGVRDIAQDGVQDMESVPAGGGAGDDRPLEEAAPFFESVARGDRADDRKIEEREAAMGRGEDSGAAGEEVPAFASSRSEHGARHA